MGSDGRSGETRELTGIRMYTEWGLEQMSTLFRNFRIDTWVHVLQHDFFKGDLELFLFRRYIDEES